jgi:hypothetical protein
MDLLNVQSMIYIQVCLWCDDDHEEEGEDGKQKLKALMTTVMIDNDDCGCE